MNLIPARRLSERHEAFAQAVARGASHSAAYRDVYGVKTKCARAAGPRLANTPEVRARIQELTDAAAERAVISIAARMRWLDQIVHADPSEVARLVSAPCPSCWTDKPKVGRKPRTPPDRSLPNPACPACRGKHVRMEITPTDELSEAGRAIFKGVRQRSDGSLHVMLEDRQAASDQLNKMQSVYVTRTLSANVSMSVPIPDSITPADALAFLKTLVPA